MKRIVQKVASFMVSAFLLMLYGVVLAISLVISAIARVPDVTPEGGHQDHKEKWQ